MSELPNAGWYVDPNDSQTNRYWDGAQWTESRAPRFHTSPAPTVGSATSPRARAAGWTMTAFGGLTVLAAMMPWASIGPFTVSGTSGDGAITLVLGLIGAGLGLIRALSTTAGRGRTAVPVTCLILGLLITAIGLFDIVDVSSEASVGAGLVLTLLAGLGLVASSVWGLARRS